VFALDLEKRGAIVTGIDASAAMIDAAKARARKHNAEAAFQLAAAHHLPFANERFDLATAITILCFVEDAHPVFRELARVLRPGGRLVIGELGRWSTWAAERRIRAWLGSRIWRRGRFRTAGELAHLAEQAGFAIESVRGAVFYPRCRLAARLLEPYDPVLGRWTTFGAGFIALAAVKRNREN
jgi:ubiquinone/menaquinone biosynthesis C-methylase UbiE